MAEKSRCFGKNYHPEWMSCGVCSCREGCRISFFGQKAGKREIEKYKEDPEKIIEQLEMCDYECVGGPLTNNAAFIALKELIDEHRFMSYYPFIGEMTISMDVSYDDYRKWYLGDWGPSPVKTYEEEKEMNEVKTVRVIGVTFNVNTHNGNDRRVFQYLCPFNVKRGDAIVADTVYGASLARVVKVDNFDANNSCYYTGLKTVISGPIDLVLSKNYAVREATEMVRECEENALTLEKIRKLENKRSKLRKDLEKTECERSFIYRELGDIQSEVCNLKRKAGISLE